jgi:hypothetical protein
MAAAHLYIYKLAISIYEMPFSSAQPGFALLRLLVVMMM